MKEPKSKTNKPLLKILCLLGVFLLLFSLFGCDVPAPPSEDVVTVTPTSATVIEGKSVTLTATSSENREISWSSSDEDIATVEGGVVTGISEGVATITANDGKKYASAEIIVIADPDKPANPNPPIDPTDPTDPTEPSEDEVKVELTRYALSIMEGTTYNIIVTEPADASVIWTTNNSEVATVNGGKISALRAGIATITATLASGKGHADCVVTVTAKPPEGKDAYPELIWADEFNGNTLESDKWGYMTGTQDNYYGNRGPSNWGNNELQYYTDGDNTAVSDGTLKITARREDRGGMEYTSARISTRDKFSFTFGYIEARVKMPAGKGMWPAFWLLPQPTNHSSSDNVYGGWARNGELDILEVQGTRPNVVMGTVHYGDNWPDNQHSGKEYTLENSTVEEWHTYAVEWTEKYIKWYVDDICYSTKRSSEYWSASSAAQGREGAPFDQPFYIIFNLAVDSGSFDRNAQGGPPEDFTEGVMEVDYVRVYQ